MEAAQQMHGDWRLCTWTRPGELKLFIIGAVVSCSRQQQDSSCPAWQASAVTASCPKFVASYRSNPNSKGAQAAIRQTSTSSKNSPTWRRHHQNRDPTNLHTPKLSARKACITAHLPSHRTTCQLCNPAHSPIGTQQYLTGTLRLPAWLQCAALPGCHTGSSSRPRCGGSPAVGAVVSSKAELE